MSSTYMDATYLSLICYPEGKTYGYTDNYWLASRAVRCDGNYADFYVRYMRYGQIQGYDLTYSGVSSNGSDNALRPLVSVPLNSVTIGKSGTGAQASPYSLEVK